MKPTEIKSTVTVEELISSLQQFNPKAKVTVNIASAHIPVTGIWSWSPCEGDGYEDSQNKKQSKSRTHRITLSTNFSTTEEDIENEEAEAEKDFAVAVASEEYSSILTKVIGIISVELGLKRDSLKPETELLSLSIDSLDLTSILMTLEQAYDLHPTRADQERFRTEMITIDDIVRFIQDRTK